MTGAAIASVAVSAYQGSEASHDAKRAEKRSENEAIVATAYNNLAMENIQSNQGEIDDFKDFLSSMSDQGTEYAQGLLDSWEQTFGGLQDNLSDYYNNLDPAKFATGEKAKFKQNLDKQMQQYNETMASSGLQSAGMRAQTAKETAFKTAEANSQIDLQSEEYVKDQQMGFLNYGDPQRQEAQRAMGVAQDNQNSLGQQGFQAQFNQNQQITDMYRTQAGINDTNAQQYGESAAGYSQAAGNYFGSAMSAGVTAYDSMFGGTNPTDSWMSSY